MTIRDLLDAERFAELRRLRDQVEAGPSPAQLELREELQREWEDGLDSDQ